MSDVKLTFNARGIMMALGRWSGRRIGHDETYRITIMEERVV